MLTGRSHRRKKRRKFGILEIPDQTNISLSQVLSFERLHAASICVFDILNLHHLSAQDVSLRGLLTCASTCEFTCAPLISHHFVDLISLQNTFFTNSWILTCHIEKHKCTTHGLKHSQVTRPSNTVSGRIRLFLLALFNERYRSSQTTHPKYNGHFLTLSSQNQRLSASDTSLISKV